MRPTKRSPRRRRLCTAVAVGMVAVAAGCGSDDDSGTTNSAASTDAAPKFEGEPIVIGVMSTLESPLGTFPQPVAGAEAAARAINADGGINGRELVVEPCNGKLDPNQEVACARRMVQKDAIASVGSFPVANGAGFVEALAKANIADLAATATFPENYQGENTFPIDFLPGMVYGCEDGAFAESVGGTKETRVLLGESPQTRNVAAQFEKAAASLGADLQPVISVAPTQTDMAPIVQEAANLGDGVVSWFMPPTQSTAFISSAVASGHDWPYCSADDGVPYEQRVKLGARLTNYFQSSSFPPLTEADKYPLLQQFADDMEAAAEAGDSDAEASARYARALRAWLGVQIVKDVAETIDGEITGESFLAALSTAKVDLDGVVPPLDFSKPIGGGDYPRVFNGRASKNKWDPNEKVFTAVPDSEVNTIEALLK